jgi:hypothetical protein
MACSLRYPRCDSLRLQRKSPDRNNLEIGPIETIVNPPLKRSPHRYRTEYRISSARWQKVKGPMKTPEQASRPFSKLAVIMLVIVIVSAVLAMPVAILLRVLGPFE